MSIQGLAAFGLGLANGYQNRAKEIKEEERVQKLDDERLADKQYQRGREKVQDQRAAAQEGRAIETYGMQKEASQMALDAAKLQTQIEGGLRRASLAYSAGDKSGAFAAFEETGNSLYPDMQMKFDRDENGNIIVDPTTGAASGQRFTATGAPVGQKISMKPEQAHQTLYAAMNPAKYVENQAAAAAEVAKAERDYQLHERKGLFDARVGVVAHGEKKRIDSRYGREEKLFQHGLDVEKLGVQHAYGIERDNNTSDNNIYRDQVKPQTGSGAASQQLVPALRGGSSSGGKWGAIPDRLPEGVNARQMAEALAPFVRQVESGGNPNAVSPKGARGSMQIIPETRDEILKRTGIDAYKSDADNVAAGTWYLEQKLKETGGNVQLALAAYNAGFGRVQQYGGVPPFTETQGYLTKINSLLAAKQGAIGNLRQNEGVAASITQNTKIVAEDLSKQLKDAGVSPAKVQSVLGMAGRSLVEMSRKTNPADQQKAFGAALTHIKVNLLANATDLSDAEKTVYAQQILSQLLGESSDSAMNNLVFDADGQALAAVNARMGGGQPNPFEGTVGIQAPTKLPTTPQALAAHAQAQPAPNSRQQLRDDIQNDPATAEAFGLMMRPPVSKPAAPAKPSAPAKPVAQRQAAFRNNDKRRFPQ